MWLTLGAVIITRRDHEGVSNADRHLMMTPPALLRHGRVFTSTRHPPRQTKHRGRRYRKETRASGPPPPSPSLPPHPCAPAAAYPRGGYAHLVLPRLPSPPSNNNRNAFVGSDACKRNTLAGRVGKKRGSQRHTPDVCTTGSSAVVRLWSGSLVPLSLYPPREKMNEKLSEKTNVRPRSVMKSQN